MKKKNWIMMLKAKYLTLMKRNYVNLSIQQMIKTFWLEL